MPKWRQEEEEEAMVEAPSQSDGDCEKTPRRAPAIPGKRRRAGGG